MIRDELSDVLLWPDDGQYSDVDPVQPPYENGARPHGHDLRGVVCLADVQPERVSWLWPGRIPFGKLSLIDGDPGLGKSLVTLDIAARLTTGRPMPDGSRADTHEPAGVVLLTAEDGLADTIRPRLDAAGADAARIVAFQITDEDGLPTIPGDVDRIEQAVIAARALLIVVDPVMAFLGEGINSNRDQHVRTALVRLAALAERTGAAVVVVRHLNKSTATNVLYRGGGSIGIIGAARSAMVVAPDPDDEDGARRIVAMSKSNLAELAPSLAYRVVGDGVPHVAWEGETSHSARTILLDPATDQERGARDEAVEFLRTALADGPRESSDVTREARLAGISDMTLRRARERLGVKPKREGFGAGGRWLWTLPSVAIDVP